MNEYIFNYSQYKKNINHKNGYNFTIIFLIIIMLLVTLIFLKPKTEKANEFYYVKIASFSTYQSALKLSQKIFNSGGAGYIYFDGKYHLLASFYSSYQDSKKVVENLKNDYPDTTILTLSYPKYATIKNLSSKQNLAVENIYNSIENTILQFETIINDYNALNNSLHETTIHIKNLYNEFNESFSNFNSAFKANSKHNLTKEHLLSIKSSLTKICSLGEPNFSATMRYELISITIHFYQFLSCF